MLQIEVNFQRGHDVLVGCQLRAQRLASRTRPGSLKADGVFVMHSEWFLRGRKSDPIPAEGPEILTDAGLACRMDSGPERGAKEPTGRTIARRSWAARGHRPRRK